jgi:Tripartite ATP-independent periplasmic transporters, DctQ component
VTVDAGSQGFAPAGNSVAGGAGGAADARSILARLDASLGLLVEMLAAGLVAAEIVILFGGVVSRYVFNRPLIWSDELASTLFLWLAMLGAVIAFRRDEHMRMTAWSRRLEQRCERWPTALQAPPRLSSCCSSLGRPINMRVRSCRSRHQRSR